MVDVADGESGAVDKHFALVVDPGDGAGDGLLALAHLQAHVLADGRIVKSGGPELALELEAHGYDFLKDRVVPEAAV